MRRKAYRLNMESQIEPEPLYEYRRGKGWVLVNPRITEFPKLTGRPFVRRGYEANGQQHNDWYPVELDSWELVTLNHNSRNPDSAGFMVGDYLPMGQSYGYVITDLGPDAHGYGRGYKVTRSGETDEARELSLGGVWVGIARRP